MSTVQINLGCTAHYLVTAFAALNLLSRFVLQLLTEMVLDCQALHAQQTLHLKIWLFSHALSPLQPVEEAVQTF